MAEQLREQAKKKNNDRGKGGGGKNFLQAMSGLIFDSMPEISLTWHRGRNGDHLVKPEECSNFYVWAACLNSLTFC